MKKPYKKQAPNMSCLVNVHIREPLLCNYVLKLCTLFMIELYYIRQKKSMRNT